MDQRHVELFTWRPPAFVVAAPNGEGTLAGACRDMVSNALDFCEQKTRLPGRQAVVLALCAGEPAAVDYFRYGLAKEVGSALGRGHVAIKAVYLYEPDIEAEETEGPLVSRPGFDLIVWADSRADGLRELAEAMADVLYDECRAVLGPATGPRDAFLNVDIVSDDAVHQRAGRGALLASIYTQPLKVWSRLVIQLNADYCGTCRVCSSVCPFAAITIDPGATAAKIDMEKCQVCGICYSACPAGAIEAAYYDMVSLARDVQSSVRATGVKTIVLSCRGSTPPAEQIAAIAGTTDFVSVCLPCVGRTEPQFFLKALSMGVEKIAVIPCQDDHCRFEDGSRIVRSRVMLMRSLLQALNYDPNLLIFREAEGPLATVDAELCTGCGTCIGVCAYGAIGASGHAGQVLLTSAVDPALCQGCGACVVACPSKAIQMSRFADPQLLARIETALASLAKAPVNGTPAILGLRCNWCDYGDVDLPFERLRYSSQNIEVVRVPCAGRVDPLHVLWAFLNGADGVYIGGCPSGDCRYLSGTDQAEQRMARLSSLIAAAGLEPRRLRLDQIRRDSPTAFAEAIKSFAAEIREIGPLDTP